MAPDDFKFVRMEARHQEQQLIMAELAGQAAGKREAIAQVDHQRQDPTMLALMGSIVAGPPRAPDEASARPFAQAAPAPRYGACQAAAPAARSKPPEPRAAKEEPPAPGATIGGNKFEAPAGGQPDKPAPGPQAGLALSAAAIEKQREADREAAPGKALDGPPRPCVIQRLARLIPCFGILLSLGASVFLGTAGMLVKLVESVHGIEVAVLRAFIQLAIYGSLICVRRTGWRPSRGEVWPVAARALLGGASITCSYYALRLIPLGDATTIRFSLPIWTLIMGYFFLREPCGLYKVAAVAISVSGVVLVTKPDDCLHVARWLLGPLAAGPPEPANLTSIFNRALHDVEEITLLAETAAPLPPPPLPPRAAAPGGPPAGPDWPQSNGSLLEVGAPLGRPARAYSDPLRQVEGCLMALASSICLSMSVVALRMCKHTPSEVSIFWLSASSAAVGITTLVALGQWGLPSNLRDCLFILLNGLCGSLGQWFMTNALKVEQSGLIALARTFDIEVAFLYSAFLLGEQIRTTSIFGAILVSLGVISVLVPRWLGCGGAPDHDHDDNSARPPVADSEAQTDVETDWAGHARGAASSSGAATDEESQPGRQETPTSTPNGLSSGPPGAAEGPLGRRRKSLDEPDAARAAARP